MTSVYSSVRITESIYYDTAHGGVLFMTSVYSSVRITESRYYDIAHGGVLFMTSVYMYRGILSKWHNI